MNPNPPNPPEFTGDEVVGDGCGDVTGELVADVVAAPPPGAFTVNDVGGGGGGGPATV